MEGSFHGDFELGFWGVETEIFRLRRRGLRHSLLVQRNAGRIRLRGICARKHAQGVPPRSEIHYVTAGSGGDIMNSMRLRPRAPPGNGQAGSGSQQRQRTQRRKIRYSRQKTFVRQAARHDSDFAFPYEGKVSAEPTDEV